MNNPEWLSNPQSLHVETAKVTEYLLNSHHPRGRSKAAFFKAVGFSELNVDEFVAALRMHAAQNKIANVILHPYGVKTVVDCSCRRHLAMLTASAVFGTTIRTARRPNWSPLIRSRPSPTVGQRNSADGQRNAAWAAPLPLRSADRSTRVHAQENISAPCFFCGKFRATPCHLMFRRRACVRDTRRGSSAEAIQPPQLRREKTLSCRKKKLRETRCLRFAARLPHAVNVRGMRESRVGVKCFPRCRILSRTTRRRCCASRSNALQAIEQASEFPRCTADCARCAA
jgi:hypothetical protein